MSKVLAGTAFVLLGGATATGGVLLLSKGSKGTEDKSGEKTKTEQIDATLSDTLDKFKTTDKDRTGGCVKNMFGNVQKLSDESGNEIAASDIGSDAAAFLGADKKTEGCLVVHWDKKSKTESGSSKWNGTFRLLWVVKGKSKGFLTFLLGTTKKDNGNGKLVWSGKAYILEDKGTNGTTNWTEIKHASVKSDSSFAGTETDLTKLPVPGNALKGSQASDSVPTFWGFFDAANKLKELDEANKPDADGAKAESLKAYWTWDGKESSEVGGSSAPVQLLTWTSNFDTWWKEVFEEGKFKVKGILENQKGTWTQKAYTLSPVNTAGS